jgi:hypothetical protein
MPAARSNGATRSAPGAELERGRRGDSVVVDRLALALEVTQEALAQVQQIAIEEIRYGLEASDHVQAAERDMRSALRQLVLAERQLGSRSLSRASLSRRTTVIADGGSPRAARDDGELEKPRSALRELEPPTGPDADQGHGV